MPSAPTASTVFEPVVGWPAVPHGIKLKEATSVAVDPDDNVYVFNRGNSPMVVFDRAGNYLDSWGTDDYIRPHGVHVTPDGDLLLVDDFGHTLKKTGKNGDVRFVNGTHGEPSAWQGGEPFNRPTDAFISPVSGDIFVTDGYGNSRVHRFTASGEHVLSWGEPGTGPGQFSLPHNVVVLDDGRVVVCDRENFRIQVFTEDGDYIEQFHFHRPQAICVGRGDDRSIYLTETRPPEVQEGVPNLGLKVRVLDQDFNEIVSFGAGTSGEKPDQFISPHGIAVDSEGSVYVAEVSYTAMGSRLDPPREVTSLRKWKRTSG
ncbi:MAG: peptidyl-alpha-hydroxyglycine alpha-amidating lyase family protein [Dehalococcoidia bacterium]|mgnify:CR=1 FL=1|jgi:DNA-binding beta-propeller fold protein YncE|nr:peptidyl-alpha-hydroxyglycine alpha-amidating lyase family protein [Dehalococcoidia bacterium]